MGVISIKGTKEYSANAVEVIVTENATDQKITYDVGYPDGTIRTFTQVEFEANFTAK